MKATVKQGDGTVIQPNGVESSSSIVFCWTPPVPPPASFAVIRISSGCAGIVISRNWPSCSLKFWMPYDTHLKTGGTLVYATCSVLPEENSQQIKAFLQRTADAVLSETGSADLPGQQNLPGAEEGDGFFYAKLIKK